ncbi:MAG TPA: hypothetical protein VJK02_23605 [Anaerolineales bacterium]|nr:hypothetical protein [Anaerolineales bacterium]
MYWIRTGDWLDVLSFLLLGSLWATGGWLIAIHGFRLEGRERAPVGLGLGVIGFIFFSNIFGHWLSPDPAFWLAGGLVLALGLFTWRYSGGPISDQTGRMSWWSLAALALIAGLILQVGRGLAIFDDYNSLPLVSAMAAGDIPPDFYMNAGQPYLYHYAFQLFGASLMRVGGFFPWSALDVSRGFLGGLALVLAASFGWRLTQRKLGGAAVAVILALASGGRWMLNFLPYSVLKSATQGVNLWGSAADSAPTLLEGLRAAWAIEGGPPSPIPLAYTNGILPPFVLNVFTGPKSLSLIALFLFLLLFPRKRDWRSVVILTLVLSVWALAAEAEFVLIALGLAVTAVLVRVTLPGHSWRKEALPALACLLPAVLISVIQGGTITEFTRLLVGRLFAAPLSSGVPAQFSLRLPPAIVSSHLGELRLDRPDQLLVGLFEIGPLLLAGPIVIWAMLRWLRRARFALVAIAVSSCFGVLIPLFVSYSVDRDITRLSGSGLLDWALLTVPVLWISWRRLKLAWLKAGILALAGATVFAGVVVLGTLLTAISRPVLSNDIAVMDAAMTRRFWDQLEPGALVLDSRGWRAVVVTGRLTRSAVDVTTDLPAWRDLVASPEAGRAALGGFAYVYVDQRWWDGMSQADKASYDLPCVLLLGEETDNSANGFRRLYDVRGCRTATE